jgi:hypothetical protein
MLNGIVDLSLRYKLLVLLGFVLLTVLRCPRRADRAGGCLP